VRPLRLVGELAELVAVSRVAARAHGGGVPWTARRARRLRSRQHYEYREALTEGLLDPAVSEAECALHGSRYETVQIQRRLNPAAIAPLAGEKALFYAYCDAAGIRTPRHYGLIDPSGPGWSAGGRSVAGAGGFARFVEEDLPDDWVIKPSAGHHGLGVRVMRRREGGLRDEAGRILTPAALHAELAADPEFRLWVVQERLENHPGLARLIQATTLQTLRIVTLIGRGGDVDVLYAVLRVAVAGGATDNFRGGLSGNGLASVSLADGRLESVKLARPSGFGFVRTAALPSGVRIEGVPLPDWEQTLALVRRAAPAFLPARTLGWDVALTPGGPVVVEANMFWWPRSGPEQAVLRERLLSA